MCVPRFSSQRTVVLVNLATLECEALVLAGVEETMQMDVDMAAMQAADAEAEAEDSARRARAEAAALEAAMNDDGDFGGD